MTCREVIHKTRKKKRRSRQRGGRDVAVENREGRDDADEGGRQDVGIVVAASTAALWGGAKGYHRFAITQLS
jgi:hypothetical protein